MASAPASRQACVAAELYHDAEGVWIISADPRQPKTASRTLVTVSPEEISVAADVVRRAELTPLAGRMLAELCSRIVAPLAELCEDAEALVLAPHGALHLLPLIAGEVHEEVSLAEAIPTTVLPSTSFLRLVADTVLPARPGEIALLRGPELGTGKAVGLAADCLAAALRARFPYQPLIMLDRPRKLVEGSILVVAAHGRPSQLLLRDREGKKTWIGAEELASELGRAVFVFLAVCRSSTTEVARDDEPLGLAWPLLARGCGAVVGSHWEVEAASVSLFADRLLAGAQAGMSIGEAYREAIREQKRDSRTRELRDWGGFIFSGDWRLKICR